MADSDTQDQLAGVSLDPFGGAPVGWQGSPMATGLVNALGGDASDAARGLGQQALSLVRTPGDVLAGRYDVRDLPSVGRDYAGNLAAFGLAMPAPEGALRAGVNRFALDDALDAMTNGKNGTSAVTTPVEHDPFTTSLVPVDHDPFATEP